MLSKYSSDSQFGFQDGFMIAAGVTDYTDAFDGSTDPTIGEFKIYRKQWNIYDENSGDLFTELKTRNCKLEDFNGIDGEEN